MEPQLVGQSEAFSLIASVHQRGQLTSYQKNIMPIFVTCHVAAF